MSKFLSFSEIEALFDAEIELDMSSAADWLREADTDALMFSLISLFASSDIEALKLKELDRLMLAAAEIEALMLALVLRNWLSPWLSTTETEVDIDALFDADTELIRLVEIDCDNDLLIDACSDMNCLSRMDKDVDSLILTDRDALKLFDIDTDSDLDAEICSDKNCLSKIESDVDSLMLTDLDVLRLCEVDIEFEMDSDLLADMDATVETDAD